MRSKRKRLGMKKGFPDYIIIPPNATVFIEMKRIKGGVTSDEQHTWITLLHDPQARRYAAICPGYEAAKRFLESVLT